MLSPTHKGMCPLAQVTMLNSARGPGKNTCHSEIPGDALCEPFIMSLSHVCRLAYSRPSDKQTRGCGRGPSRAMNNAHWLSSAECLSSTSSLSFNHSYYCRSCSEMKKKSHLFSKVKITHNPPGNAAHVCVYSSPAGSAYYDNVRPLAYPDADAVLICFDISRPETLDSVLKKVSVTLTEV